MTPLLSLAYARQLLKLTLQGLALASVVAWIVIIVGLILKAGLPHRCRTLSLQKEIPKEINLRTSIPCTKFLPPVAVSSACS